MCKKRFVERFSCRLRICCYFLKIRYRLTEVLTTRKEGSPNSCPRSQSCRLRPSLISIDSLGRDIATNKISARSDNSFGRYCMPKCQKRTFGIFDYFYIMSSFSRTAHRQIMKFIELAKNFSKNYILPISRNPIFEVFRILPKNFFSSEVIPYLSYR